MNCLGHPRSLPRWQEVAAQKRECDLRKIPVEWRLPEDTLERARKQKNIADSFIDELLDVKTRRITNLDAPALIERSGDGSLTALEVVTAFCKRAALAHQLNYNLLEIGFGDAIERAKQLDEFWKAHRRPSGPLHGLPVTMKDQFHVKGMGTTMGYVGWIDSFEGDKTSDLKCRAESELVRKLESLGAIVIAKTTLVQSVWYWETNNNILGYHRNPRSQGLSSGGSSGGEGGTQAMRCSAVGFGTDIGGSVSMPAAFNGVFSIKPSAGRLPTKNMPNSSLGQINIPTVVGMLGPSIATLRHVFRALISSEPWNTDPSVLPIPWREPKLPAKLSFGFMEFEGAARPHPPVIRALKMAKAALEKAGHEAIPWKGPSLQEAVAIHSSIVRADGNFDVFDRLALSGEPLIPELVPLAPTGKPQPPKTAIEVAQYVQRMMIYRARYQAYWQSTSAKTASGHPVDAVLLPVTTSAALIPGKPLYHEYITLVNVIDHATLVVPITRADETVDTFEKDYVPSEELDRKIWESCGRSNSFSCAVLILVDDPAAYNGAPAAIQVLAGRLDEEKLLAVGQVVVDAVREYGSS